MDPNIYTQQISRLIQQQESQGKWLAVIGLIICLTNFFMLFIFIIKSGHLMTAAAKYLETKSVLLLAQLEGHRFVEERTERKPIPPDDSKYQPKM